MTNESEPLVYSVNEAARLLGLSRNAAFRAVNAGKLPARRIGRRWVIPRDRLAQWLNGAEVQ